MKADLCRDDALELLLDDQHSHPEFESVVSHLSECSRCQQRLDDLSAHPVWWRNVRRHLVNVEETVVPQLPDAAGLVTAQVEDTGVMPNMAVDTFLDPPSHPEMLVRIGKYDIEREIGRGGMGIVLKGFDRELNRPVAIKLLSPHLASSGIARQRFVREARAAAAVAHENVVAIHGIETQGALPSIVMPFVSGQSLQQHIEEHGPLEAIDVVRIGVQVASGLAAAHEQGLVHRDIKPANIMLENSINRVQITDFGLARAAHDANLTRSGIIAGTPSFMAPEQALSEVVDHRADLFSLGSVLYFAATGVLPFRASTPIGVMQQVCEAKPQRVRELSPQTPEMLESVIEKLQAEAADDRFQTAAELQKYLNEYLGHLQQPTSRKPPRTLRSPAAVKRRQRLQRRLGVVAGMMLCALLLAGFALRPGLFGAKAPAEPTAVPVVALSVLDEEIGALAAQIAALEAEQQPDATQSAPVGMLSAARSRAWWSAAESRELLGIDAEIRLLESDRAFGRLSSGTSNGRPATPQAGFDTDVTFADSAAFDAELAAIRAAIESLIHSDLSSRY